MHRWFTFRETTGMRAKHGASACSHGFSSEQMTPGTLEWLSRETLDRKTIDCAPIDTCAGTAGTGGVELQAGERVRGGDKRRRRLRNRSEHRRAPSGRQSYLAGHPYEPQPI